MHISQILTGNLSRWKNIVISCTILETPGTVRNARKIVEIEGYYLAVSRTAGLIVTAEIKALRKQCFFFCRKGEYIGNK